MCQVFMVLLPAGYAAASTAAVSVSIIPVSGDVDPGMAAFIERALKDTASSDIIIFEMDTFGGRVDSALKIVDTISDVTGRKTIAYVSNKAISAGALIALSCNELVMKQHTTIGDCAPISFSSEGPQMMGEKFQSPLRAKFRALARKNNYPQALSEAMVTPDMEVLEVITPTGKVYMDSVAYPDLPEEEKKKILSKRIVVKKGELLTMDDAEALQLGFSRMSVSDLDELTEKLGISASAVTRIEQKWSEILSRFIHSIAPILLMVGLGTLYIELKAPGFGLPGMIGIVCLSLVFFNQYIVGLADYTELIVIALGFVLLGFEMFVIPGFGIAGIAGFICLAVGMVLAFQDFMIPDPKLPWQGELLLKNVIQVLGSLVTAFLFSLLFLRYGFPKLSKVIPGPYLSSTLTGSHADSMEVIGIKPGDTGIAGTALRPSGKAEIGRRTVDVIADGEFIDKGTAIKVSEIKGNRIIVIRDSYHE
ncbi:MAG: serine protease [Desulfobacteraceae bacterium]|nr:MAG: serine protease [Desulfobacteraceae bacterium]